MHTDLFHAERSYILMDFASLSSGDGRISFLLSLECHVWLIKIFPMCLLNSCKLESICLVISSVCLLGF